jgi:hypothetical protein
VNGSEGMWAADFNLQEAKLLPLHRPEARMLLAARVTTTTKPERETKYSDQY